jgi:predicted nucleotidyltransferase
MTAIPADKQSRINEAALAIASQFGDQVEQIILYGSQSDGNAHEESDYDFGVILSADVGQSWEAEIQAQALAEAILNTKVDLCVTTRQAIEHNKHLHLNIEAKILTGKVIVDTGRRAVISEDPPLLDELKLDAANRMMRACTIHLSNSKMYGRHMSSGLMTYDVCLHSILALCWALKAQLALNGVDATERSIRWNPAALANLAIQHGVYLKPEMTESLAHVKDIDHLSQWVGDNPAVDVALSFQTQAAIVSQYLAEQMSSKA